MVWFCIFSHLYITKYHIHIHILKVYMSFYLLFIFNSFSYIMTITNMIQKKKTEIYALFYNFNFNVHAFLIWRNIIILYRNYYMLFCLWTAPATNTFVYSRQIIIQKDSVSLYIFKWDKEKCKKIVFFLCILTLWA